MQTKRETLRRMRLSQELTQEKVAEEAGINVQYYSRIERGEKKPKFETILSISKALNRKPVEIFAALLDVPADEAVN